MSKSKEELAKEQREKEYYEMIKDQEMIVRLYQTGVGPDSFRERVIRAYQRGKSTLE